MRKYLSTLLFVVFGATAAQAERPFNWTGFYVGAHGGWSDWTLSRPDDLSAPTQTFDGFSGGMQIGYDRQLGSIVLGVVADASVGDLQGPTYKDGNFITVHSQIDWFGTLRGRLGVPIGHIMPYVTGGAAWMVGTTTENCPAGAGGGHCLAKGQYTETGDLSRWGWAYGGGFEMKLGGNVSLFAEYLRMDFGTEKEDLGPLSNNRDVKISDIDVVRGGVNFKF